jgi:streptogramin lyase
LIDRQGVLWFIGQNGVYGRLDPKTGTMALFGFPEADQRMINATQDE